MHKLSLAVLLPFVLTGNAARLNAADEARTVIEKAIEAHGGKAVLSKQKCEVVRTEGTVVLEGITAKFTNVTTTQLPGQFKNVTHCSLLGTDTSIIQVLNGDQAWVTVNGEVQPITDVLRAEMEQTKYAEEVTRLVPLLEDKAFQLTLLGVGKVRDQTVTAVRVRSKGHGDIELFFDQTTGLLAKTKRDSLNGKMQPAVQEVYWSSYQRKDGINRPMKFVGYQDGKKFTTAQITDVKYPDKIDEKEFTKP